MPISPVPETVIVHPLVLLSAVDHYNRVAKNTKKRVVGVLLGQNSNNKVINVANSYALPFEEDEKDPSIWFLDHDYLESMWDMTKKINARERIIGWYHSGPKLRQCDLEINEVLKRYTPNPVLVVIDVQPDSVGLPTESYVAIEEIHDDGTTTTKTFAHIPCEIQAEEAEEVGVEHLLRDVKDIAAGSLSTRITTAVNSLGALESHLKEIEQYLEQVTKGELPQNHQVLYNLQTIFNLLPNMQDPELAKAFSVVSHDRSLVVYLSSIARAVISLHRLIDNKLENKETEYEGLNEVKKEEPTKKPADEKVGK